MRKNTIFSFVGGVLIGAILIFAYMQFTHSSQNTQWFTSGNGAPGMGQMWGSWAMMWGGSGWMDRGVPPTWSGWFQWPMMNGGSGEINYPNPNEAMAPDTESQSVSVESSSDISQ